MCIHNMEMTVKWKRKFKGLIYILEIAKKLPMEILSNVH